MDGTYLNPGADHADHANPAVGTIALLARCFANTALLMRNAGLAHEASVLTRCTALPSSPCAQKALDAVAMTARLHWGARGMPRTPALSTALEAIAVCNAAFVAASVWPEASPPTPWLMLLSLRLIALTEGRAVEVAHAEAPT